MLSSRFIMACLAAAPVGLAAPDTPKLPDRPGKATMVPICAGFPGPGTVLGQRLDRDGWNQIVVNMVHRGAEGSDDEFAERTPFCITVMKKGKFKTIDDLKQMPGLDTAKNRCEKESAGLLQ